MSGLLAWIVPRGRLSRGLYARRVLGLALGSALLLWLAIAVAAGGWRIAALAFAAGVAGLWLVGLAQTVRRLHDRGRSGWWLAPALVILAMSVTPLETAFDTHPIQISAYAFASAAYLIGFLLETLGRRGTAGANRYGAVPPE